MSLPDYIVKLIDDVAKSEKFIEYSTELNAASKRGENFTGELVFLVINGMRNINGNSTFDSKPLVLKMAPSSRNRRQVFQAITGFKCEVEMYTKVLPAFMSFQEGKNLKTEDKFLSFPKVYATIFDEERDQFGIIMEDLRIKNYKMYPRLECTTYEHAKLVMTNLAKYHALSFALKDQNLPLFEEIVRNDTLSSRFMKDDLGYEIINVLDRSIDNLENEKHKELVNDLKLTYLEWVEKFSSEQFVGESGVLLHGDCWSNNVLFQYNKSENSEIPLDAVFIDWQMSRYGPPIIDIFYFLLSTTDKSFREKHFNDLINHYHSILSATIEKLGSNAAHIYPLSKFQTDLIKFNRFPLIFALVSVLFRLADENHILDLDEYAQRICNGERPKLILNLDVDTEILYKKALNDAVTDVVNYCNID